MNSAYTNSFPSFITRLFPTITVAPVIEAQNPRSALFLPSLSELSPKPIVTPPRNLVVLSEAVAQIRVEAEAEECESVNVSLPFCEPSLKCLLLVACRAIDDSAF